MSQGLRVAIAHQMVTPEAPPDEQDVLVEAAAVEAALSAKGHTVQIVECGLDLQALLGSAAIREADVVFNLVESLAGSGRLIHLPLAVLEAAGKICTGNSVSAQVLTSGKLVAKRLLKGANLPTAPWVSDELPLPAEGMTPCDWIVKSEWEHASLGLDDAAVLRNITAPEARNAAQARGVGWFAEEFLDGREFNVSLLECADGTVRVLPPAELVFVDYPAGKPRIIGYDAKWSEASFECQRTVRHFLDAASEPQLCAHLSELARACWHLFGLSGYARVDFRSDTAGQIAILEVNANPCLSPDAGFAAALAAGGVEYGQAIEHILMAARRSKGIPSAAQRDKKLMPKSASELVFRVEVTAGDVAVVKRLVEATQFFYDYEVAVAQELVMERLAKGEESGYNFIFVESAGEVVGYSCFGPIPCTRSSFDLYWIVVAPGVQGGGVGRKLLQETEGAVRRLGGTRLYAETSGRPQYEATRLFYERTGFDRVSVLRDFYDIGDDRVTYCKVL